MGLRGPSRPAAPCARASLLPSAETPPSAQLGARPRLTSCRVGSHVAKRKSGQVPAASQESPGRAPASRLCGGRAGPRPWPSAARGEGRRPPDSLAGIGCLSRVPTRPAAAIARSFRSLQGAGSLHAPGGGKGPSTPPRPPPPPPRSWCIVSFQAFLGCQPLLGRWQWVTQARLEPGSQDGGRCGGVSRGDVRGDRQLTEDSTAPPGPQLPHGALVPARIPASEGERAPPVPRLGVPPGHAVFLSGRACAGAHGPPPAGVRSACAAPGPWAGRGPQGTGGEKPGRERPGQGTWTGRMAVLRGGRGRAAGCG